MSQKLSSKTAVFSEKPDAEILDHILRGTIGLMEDQVRSWERPARRARDNDWGSKINQALAASGERPSATVTKGYIEMCERCAQNLTDAASQLRAVHERLRKQGLSIDS